LHTQSEEGEQFGEVDEPFGLLAFRRCEGRSTILAIQEIL
jgi:hypothetical protein